MTSMKEDKYYRYYDNQKNEYNILKINKIDYKPDGCMYGTSLKYKLWVDAIVGNVGLIYTSRYYWDKEATEITKEEALVESI